MKDLRSKAFEMIKKARRAQREHKSGPQCDSYKGIACGGCHYWAGVITTLAELLDIPLRVETNLPEITPEVNTEVTPNDRLAVSDSQKAGAATGGCVSR